MHTYNERQAGCRLGAMHPRAVLLASLAIVGGCAAWFGDSANAPAIGQPPPECRAESYAFAGRGTLAGLGLVGQSAAELPEPNRPARIWVTRGPGSFDDGEFDGLRMLCFEFEDGNVATEWPVTAAWQAPGAPAEPPATANPTIPLLLLVAVVAVVTVTVAVAGFAFRRR